MPYPNIYPDPETRQLRQALAAENGISADHLLVGLPPTFLGRPTALG
jgi:histidinol-phosphate aminotransferase